MEYPNGNYLREKVYNKKGVAMQPGVSPINVLSIINSPANAMLNGDLQSLCSPVNVMLNGKVPTPNSSKILKPSFLENPIFLVTLVYNEDRKALVPGKIQ